MHVLSTPPAFVLSQDQTLREGLFDSPGKPGSSTQKVAATWLRDGFNHWFIRADCFSAEAEERNYLLDVPKESQRRSSEEDRRRESCCMALTFGTLLSSQGADAHRRDPLGPFGGNPRNITPGDFPPSNRIRGFSRHSSGSRSTPVRGVDDTACDSARDRLTGSPRYPGELADRSCDALRSARCGSVRQTRSEQ